MSPATSHRLRTSIAPAILVWALFAAPPLASQPTRAELEAAYEAATEALSATRFVAKTDLGNLQEFYVHPDGSPVIGEGKQGRGLGANVVWVPGGRVKVRAGDIGESIFVTGRGVRGGSTRRDPQRYWVHLNPKRGQKLNPASVAVVFDRPVIPADITPEAIARALSSVVTIEGFEPGADVAAAIDEILEAAPEVAPAPAAPTTAQATVSALEVRAEPALVRAGEEVRLLLLYQVRASGGEVTAVETRELSLEGRMMPTFPLRDEIPRTEGAYTSTYRQPLPASAAPGRYRFEGQVCVADDCIRRAASFEVVPE